MRNVIVFLVALAILTSASPTAAQAPTGACIDWSIKLWSRDLYGNGSLIQWLARVTASCGVDSGDVLLDTSRGYVNEVINLVCWCEWTNYEVHLLGYPPNISARLFRK